MKIRAKFKVDLDDSDLHERIKAFMSKERFKVVSKENPLIYKRGTVGGSDGSFNPQKWLCKAEIKFIPEADKNMLVTFHVTPLFRIVMPWERAFWRAEILDLENAIRTGEIDSTRSERVLAKAIRRNEASFPLQIIGVTVATIACIVLPMLVIYIIFKKIFHFSESDSTLIGAAWVIIIFPFLFFFLSKKKFDKLSKK